MYVVPESIIRYESVRRSPLIGKMTVVLAVFLILFMAVGIAEEERTDASGQWKYVLEDGGSVITGYVEEPTGDLVIPSELDGYPVTRIGTEAFSECVGLTVVTIPDGVTHIGDNAFEYCISLVLVNMPVSVTHIGDNAFDNCISLVLVNMPVSVTHIGSYAFFSCAIFELTIPASITSIGDYAFSWCENLTDVTIPDSVTSIGDGVFEDSGIQTLFVAEGSYAAWYADENDIPYTYGVAGDEETAADVRWTYVLEDGGATITGYEEEPGGTLTIPAELDGYPVTGIGDNAFELCESLAAITAIPDGITHIGDFAFSTCESLKIVTIPDSVVSIGEATFILCEKLVAVTIPNSITSISDHMFYCCYSLVDVAIPDGVTSIGDSAFERCISLAGITIPGSVTSIGDHAFDYCENLVLTVDMGSYAEEYAQENGIPYVLAME